jgi:serine/threonine protein kinase
MDNKTMQIDLDSLENSREKSKATIKDTFPFLKKKQVVDERISESQIFETREIEKSHQIDRKNLRDIKETYEVLDTFAEGGLGKIKKGKDKTLERQVAIKSLKKDFLNEDYIVENFAAEAKLTAQLDHPAIAPLYGINTDSENGLHLAMKLINGITLREYLEKVDLNYKMDGIGAYDEQAGLVSRLERFLKICEAISYAHSKNVVHRDLKPENVMLGNFGEVYVMDWGIATVLQDIEGEKTKVAGTPAYIAPEVLHGKPYSIQADIFALGMMLFELTTLKPGVTGNNVNEILTKVKNGSFEKPDHKYSCHISNDLKSIILKAICPDSNKRYQTVDDLAEDIRAYLRFDAVSASPDNFLRKIWRWIFKHKAAAAIIVLSFVMLCLSLLIASLYQQKELIKESKRREMILAQTQSRVSEKAHSIDRLFLNLQNKLESFGNKIVYLLSHPKTSGPKIYSNAEFAKDSTAPPGTMFSNLYGKKVNLNYPVFHAVNDKVTPDDQQILTSLGETIGTDMKKTLFNSGTDASFYAASEKKLEEKALEKGFPLRWLYVGFKTGLFISYPGKTGYPPQYDPRKRPWYNLGLKGRNCQWGSPYLDINGLGIMLPGALSLYDDKNNFYGVAGMDVTFDFIKKDLMHSQENHSIKYLLDKQGQIVISSGKEIGSIATDKAGNKTLSLKAFPDKKALTAILSQKNGLIESAHKDENFIVIFTRLDSLGWTYVEKYNKENLFKLQ